MHGSRCPLAAMSASFFLPMNDDKAYATNGRRERLLLVRRAPLVLQNARFKDKVFGAQQPPLRPVVRKMGLKHPCKMNTYSLSFILIKGAGFVVTLLWSMCQIYFVPWFYMRVLVKNF
jgi:hypothetical protein